MKEADVKKIVVDYLRLTGWLVVRMPPSIYSNKGIADLYCIKGGISLWLEIKGDRGRLSKEQEIFGQEIVRKGGYWYVIRGLEELKEALENISDKLKGGPGE